MRELEERTGVGREAIRFYIREGMLPQPEKPKRNVADYSEEHVSRIRLIKDLQEKRFLPLKVVKAVLDVSADSEQAGSGRVPGIEHFLPALLDSTPTPDRALNEVARAAGFSSAEIDGMAETGAITIKPGRMLDFRDAAIVETWSQAVAAGFDRDHGYLPDYLSLYVKPLQQLARDEVARFVTSIGDNLAPEEAAAVGADGVNLANQLMTLMHTKFILEALNERAVGDDAEA